MHRGARSNIRDQMAQSKLQPILRSRDCAQWYAKQFRRRYMCLCICTNLRFLTYTGPRSSHKFPMTSRKGCHAPEMENYVVSLVQFSAFSYCDSVPLTSFVVLLRVTNFSAINLRNKTSKLSRNLRNLRDKNSEIGYKN